MSQAISDYGTLLKRENDPVGTGTYSVLAEILKIEPPELSNPMVEVTHHSSGGYKEKIPGTVKEVGEVKVTVNWLATGTASTTAYATLFQNDLVSSTARDYQIDFPVSPTTPTGTYSPSTWQFEAYVSKVKPAAIDSQKQQSLQCEITLSPTGSLILVP